MFEITPKMLAKNYFPDIIGINLEYALDTYDWDPQITQIDADYENNGGRWHFVTL